MSAATDPIETLTVKVEADASDLLDGIAKGVDEGKKKLDEFDDAAKKTGKTFVDSAGRIRDEFGRYIKTTDDAGAKTKGFGAKARDAFGLASNVAGKLLDVIINIAAGAVQMFKNLANESIGLASNFEQVKLTFTNIFKSEDKATEFLSDLRGEATKLGISFDDASQFAKSIFPDTKNVEEFNRVLKNAAIGAADANLPLSELIFSFNEAVAGDFVSIRDRLDIPKDVIERIKAAPDTVSALNEELEKLFEKRGVSNLEAMANTFEGLKRQIAGFREGLLGIAGQKILEPLRSALKNIVDIIKEYGPSLSDVASKFGEVVALVLDFAREEVFNKIFNPVAAFSFVEALQDGVKWLKDVAIKFLDVATAAKVLGGEFVKFLSVFKPILDFQKQIIISIGHLIAKYTGLGLAFTNLSENVEAAGGKLGALEQASITAAKGTAIITAVISGLTETIKGSLVAIGGLGKALGALITGNLEGLKAGLTQTNTGIKQLTEGGAAAFKKSMLESAAAINTVVEPLEEVTEGIEGLGNAMEETAEEAAVPLLDQGKLDSFSNQLIEATENRAKEQEKLEADHAAKTLDIINDANDKALDIEKNYTDDLADLTQESEKKRLGIIADTRRDLVKLADETDRDLKDKQKEFNDDEQRETEDHLKEMRRMQEDHLLDLEDAVRSRDAGAIVDLQRRFQTESSRKEEDFNTGQSRGEADFSDELNQIRENEATKRNELLTKQSEQLDDLRQHEEEKRAEIEMRRIEENEKLQQNLTERLQKENDSFVQRQAALDEALQKQLAAIAKNLADEKEVTEEGAREILETFDEYFGIGGNIDELMSDFSRRRKIRADITVAFQGETSEPQTTSEALSSGGSFGGRKRLGGVQEFAEGGTLVADKPTLALFGEAGPEVVQFTPMSQLSSPGGGEPGRMVIEMTGSAPPGIGSGERDQIAAVLLTALQDSGALN